MISTKLLTTFLRFIVDRGGSEFLNQIVEDLPNFQSFEPRSQSAIFFQSLLSRRPELARRLGLDARCDLNCV